MSNPYLGIYVSQPPDNVSGLVVSGMNYGRNYGTLAFNEASSLMQQLGQISTNFNIDTTGIPLSNETIQDFSTLIFTMPTEPTLPSFTAVLPVAPNLSIIPAYVSDFITLIKNWMTNEITNGGTGLSAQTQADIYNYQVERDLQTLADAKDRQANIWANPNWSLPDGVLEAALTKLEVEYMFEKFKTSRDIRIEAEKIAIDQLKFAIAEGSKLETALMEYGPQLLEILAKVYGEEVGAYKAQIDATATLIKALIDKFVALIGAVEASARVALGQEEIAVKVFEARMTQTKANAEILIKELDLQLEALKSETSLKMEAMKGGAIVAAQLCSGAMSSAHVQAHVGYSGSSSYAASESGSLSMSSNWTETSSGDA